MRRTVSWPSARVWEGLWSCDAVRGLWPLTIDCDREERNLMGFVASRSDFYFPHNSSHNLCSQVNTGHVSDHHTPSQIWISLHTITYNTKLDARYVIKHGKMVLLYWEGERFQASFAWKKQICWHGVIQFCKYTILSQKKYTNLLQSEPFYHVEQDIIMVSKLDTIVLVFNENYRDDGVLLSSLDLLR